jgi:diacylglycerol kinase
LTIEVVDKRGSENALGAAIDPIGIYYRNMAYKKFLSFGDSLNGLSVAWREEAHFKVHVAMATTALLASWAFQISKIELMFVVVMIGIVMTAEIFNTALEELCDKFSPTHDPHIGKIKDLAAAAVFTSSVAAFIVGVIIFYPYLRTLT